jgi:hypothetical protein
MLLYNNNDDILLRVMEYLGPHHACIGLGSTCRNLRRLSKDDSLWRAFWVSRCCLHLLPPSSSRQHLPGRKEEKDKNKNKMKEKEKDTEKEKSRYYCGGDNDDDDIEEVGPHGTALVFRRVMREMDRSGGDVVATPSPSPLYEAYVRVHTMMKLHNLRVEAIVVGGGGSSGRIIPKSDDDIAAVERLTNLIAPACTQTWPGRLSDRRVMVDDSGIIAAGDNNNNDNNNGRVGAYVITCLNPAEAWCDDPKCDVARCGGSRGCLRRYRFSPIPPIISSEFLFGTGGSDRECESPLSFVKCSWCCVSFCNEHGGGGGSDDYFERRRRHPGGGGGGICGMRSWYECDECNLSSCPDCVSQVFPLYPPDEGGCRVVTAGRACRRSVCAMCVWRVGRKKQPNGMTTMTEHVPGGDYGHLRRESSSYDVVTTRGIESHREEWEEYETCCSRCLRHVEFRWRELTRVHESFSGFMP